MFIIKVAEEQIASVHGDCTCGGVHENGNYILIYSYYLCKDSSNNEIFKTIELCFEASKENMKKIDVSLITQFAAICSYIRYSDMSHVNEIVDLMLDWFLKDYFHEYHE